MRQTPEKLAVKTRSCASSYPVFIGAGLLGNAYSLIAPHTSAQKFLIVADSHTAPLFLDEVTSSFPKDRKTFSLILPAGERHKSFSSLKRIWEKAGTLGLKRTDCIIALGGGVVGDITGFAAATYMRGVDFVQIPTTLLAMVDSSVGGKTAIDFARTKNLIGAFYQPQAVIADIAALHTLPHKEILNGLGEIAKYAFIENIADANGKGILWQKLKKGFSLKDTARTTAIIKTCVALKAKFVKDDEHDTKDRRIFLNFGHTTAHALESLANFKLSHGQAVAIGSKVAFDIALKKGLIDAATHAEGIDLLKGLGLETNLPKGMDMAALNSFMLKDKKNKGDSLRFILPTALGKAEIFDLQPPTLNLSL